MMFGVLPYLVRVLARFLVVAEVAVLHVVGERLAEPQAGVAGQRGEAIRERVLVVGRPSRQLAQPVDDLGRDGPFSVDPHVRAA